MATWVRATHVGGVWVGVGMSADVLWFAIDRAALWDTSWAGLVFQARATAVLVGLTLWEGPSLCRPAEHWPLAGHETGYAWFATAPGALLVFAATIGAALFASG